MKVYYLNEKGEPQEPTSEAGLIELFGSGEIGEDTLVFVEGSADWQSFSDYRAGRSAVGEQLEKREVASGIVAGVPPPAFQEVEPARGEIGPGMKQAVGAAQPSKRVGALVTGGIFFAVAVLGVGVLLLMRGTELPRDEGNEVDPVTAVEGGEATETEVEPEEASEVPDVEAQSELADVNPYPLAEWYEFGYYQGEDLAEVFQGLPGLHASGSRAELMQLIGNLGVDFSGLDAEGLTVCHEGFRDGVEGREKSQEVWEGQTASLLPEPMRGYNSKFKAVTVGRQVAKLRAATKERPFVNSLGLEFVPVPGLEGVWMARTETRVRDFRAYVEATGYRQHGGAYMLKVTADGPGWELDAEASWQNPGFEQTGDHPVVCVSWEEARAFCEWLSRQEPGLTYRLPSDAEWSAGVGGIGKYPWGSEWPAPAGAGNYFGKEMDDHLPGSGWRSAFVGDHRDGAVFTAPVGSYRENRSGFFDLGGNVYEWCEDEYKTSMNDRDALEAVPALKEERDSVGTRYRVVRGGSWNDVTEVILRSSYRLSGLPTDRGAFNGFRLVVVAGGDG